MAMSRTRQGKFLLKFLILKEYTKVIINGLDVNYLLPGNDLIVNDLESINVDVHGEHIHLSGKQKK